MMNFRKTGVAAVLLWAATLVATVVVFTSDYARGQGVSPAGTMAADLRQKAQARVEAAEKALDMIERRMQPNEVLTPEFLELRGGWMRRLAEARIDATDGPAARMRVAEEYVQQCRDLLTLLRKRVSQDATSFQIAQAAYYVADAEYLLAKMQAK